MRTTLSRLLVLGAVLAVPSAAGAQTNGIPTATPLAGPVLAGTRVIWAVDDHGGFDVRQASSRRAGSTLARFRSGNVYYGLIPELAASRERIVIANASGDNDQPWASRTVLTGAARGSLETLDRDCRLFGYPDYARVVDVSGEVVAFPRCTDDGRQQVVVRDYSAPVPAEQVIPGAQTAGLRVAGRYVAWLEGYPDGVRAATAIDVYDRERGRMAYRVPRASMPGDPPDLDLQDDGTVAFSTLGRSGRIAWASVAEPRPHVLSLPVRNWSEVRIAGDKIGFESEARAFAGETTRGEVGVVDLHGHHRLLGNLGEGSIYTDDFDFDGRRIAWWSYGCTRAFVHVVSVKGPAAISLPRAGCRLRFTGPPRMFGRTAHLEVDCFGFPLGYCEATHVTMTVRRGHRRVPVAHGNAARRVTLSKPAFALLQRRGHLRVRVTATLRGEDGPRERRSGPLILRARRHAPSGQPRRSSRIAR